MNQVWVGAITDDNKGAFSIYFGANDERNYSEVFVKENDMQDVDYAYSLVSLEKEDMYLCILTNLCIRVHTKPLKSHSFPQTTAHYLFMSPREI